MMKSRPYYANAIDILGNDIEIPVNEDGTVQIPSSKKIKSLKTNALNVFCRNNELEVFEAPNAISVGCNKNKIKYLHLNNAETVNCSENALIELIAPKATQVKCIFNQLTQLSLESVVELECYGNSKLMTLHAPNLRKIDCDISQMNNQETFVSIKEIEIELKNSFNINDNFTYDTNSLKVEVNLDLHKELFIEDLTFQVSLQEINYFSYEDESDIDAFSIYLMQYKKVSQYQNIITQVPKLPFLLNKPTTLEFSIPIRFGKNKNLLDIIKQAPSQILEYEKQLVLHITFYMNLNKTNEKYYYRMFTIDNPFYKSL